MTKRYLYISPQLMPKNTWKSYFRRTLKSISTFPPPYDNYSILASQPSEIKMRLLSWMHHKSWKTNADPFKDFTIGNYCNCLSAQSLFDGNTSYTRLSFNSGYLGLPNEECRNTSSGTDAKEVEQNYEDETSMAISELFHGFLAIGTLGSDPINSEPATPTFLTLMENITEGKTEVTENDLQLINEELEKFLEAEEDESNESMARSSCVSTITLGGTQMEGANVEDYGNKVICPLQGYLFGSSIELPEPRLEFKKERVSLGEMFHRTKITDEVSAENEGKEKKQPKQAHTSAKHFIKKMLKKFRASPRYPDLSSIEDAANSISTQKKIAKVLKVFHRKVHPENFVAEKECTKLHKEKTKKNLQNGGYCEDSMHQEKENENFLPRPKPMEWIQCHKNSLWQPQDDLSGSISSETREYWIKTDADYLVLEL